MRTLLLLSLCLSGCGGGDTPNAAGPPQPVASAPAPAAPVAEVGPDGPDHLKVASITEISTDAADIAAGLATFTAKGCGGCHKFGEKVVGPDLKGIFARRSPIWVERMIAEPGVMVKQDPQAKKLLRELMVEMPKQGVTDDEMPKLLAYVKSQGG
jgi:hypothetical protein